MRSVLATLCFILALMPSAASAQCAAPAGCRQAHVDRAYGVLAQREFAEVVTRFMHVTGRLDSVWVEAISPTGQEAGAFAMTVRHAWTSELTDDRHQSDMVYFFDGHGRFIGLRVGRAIGF